MEVSARIPLVDPRPALVVARRWESAAPGASLESEGAYLDRVEWVARRFAHVPNHVRCTAREYPVCSLSISRSIRILSIAFGGRAAMLVRVELPGFSALICICDAPTRAQREVAEAPYAIRSRENVARHVAE